MKLRNLMKTVEDAMYGRRDVDEVIPMMEDAEEFKEAKVLVRTIDGAIFEVTVHDVS